MASASRLGVIAARTGGHSRSAPMCEDTSLTT